MKLATIIIATLCISIIIIGYLCVLPFTEIKSQANNNVINHCKSDYLHQDVKYRVFFSIFRAKHLAGSFASKTPCACLTLPWTAET